MTATPRKDDSGHFCLLLRLLDDDIHAGVKSLEEAAPGIPPRSTCADRCRRITDCTLEGLAKTELNLLGIVGESVEAKKRRLVPEIIEDSFTHAGPAI